MNCLLALKNHYLRNIVDSNVAVLGENMCEHEPELMCET